MSSLKTANAAEVPEMPLGIEKSVRSQGPAKNPIPSSKAASNGSPSVVPLTPGIVSRKRRRPRGRNRPKGNHLNKDKITSNGGAAVTGNIDAGLRQEQKKELNIGSPRKKKSKKSKSHEGDVQGGVLAPRRSVWKTSSPFGGRFLHIDPVFAQDEKFLLLAHSRTLLVYSTKTSLLVRAMDLDDSLGDFIKTFILDPRDGNRVYVGTSMSRLLLWDWTCGRLLQSWRLQDLRSIESIASCADEEAQSEGSYGIVYVGGSGSNGPSGLWRFELLESNLGPRKPPIYEDRAGSVPCIQVFNAGKIVAAAMGHHLLIGNKRPGGSSESTTWGTFRKYPMSFRLTCMDGYLPGGPDPAAKRPKQGNESKLGDIVVGDQHGALHLFHNSLEWREGWNREPVVSRLHWHRSGVKSAKFALDGNYIVSGGSETVLVMWQLSTNHKQFLPHLGATIENIVISPKGSSYAVSLSDNSVMVLSTTELKPRANIAGIQSCVYSQRANLLRLPCVLHPSSPNRLLLATPSAQTDIGASLPYLQTYDIVSNRQISRQALARTNATIINKGPDDYSIVEPNILHLAITADGEWLATIDEWKPPKGKPLLPDVGQDSPTESGDGQGSEIFLKFWKWDEKSKSWDLVTRVDSPHPSSSRPCAEEVFDLVATPKGHGFATVGADGSARIWKARPRTKGGIRVRGGESELVTWGCGKVVRYSKGKGDLQLSPPGLLDGTDRLDKREWWGRLAFSEDGSVMVVAVPDARGEDSIVHIVDATTGIIRHSMSGLQVGKTTGTSILERHLVLLGSTKLLLWNLVNGKVEWEFGLDTLGATRESLCHLATDRHSQTFAIAVSTRKAVPRVFIFETRNPAPVHTTAFESGYPIMALKASGTGKGYISLDSQARARWLSPVLAPHESATQQTAEGGGLEEGVEGETAVGVLSGGYLLNGMTAESNGDLTMYDEDGDDGEIVDRVVPRQALESIFGATPSYATGPLEEAYEKVLALFAKKPLGDGESEEEGDGAGKDDMVDDE